MRVEEFKVDVLLQAGLPDRERLRGLIVRSDLEGFLDALSPLIPGTPGSTTRKNHLSGLRGYLRWASEHQRSILSPTAQDAFDFKAFLTGKFTGTSVKTRLSQVRIFYDALEKVKLVSAHPWRDVHGPTVSPETHKTAYSQEDLEHLLQHADLEARTLLLLGAHGGLTSAEVLALRFEDLQLQDGVLTVRGRHVQASRELWRALTEWGKTRGHTALFEATGHVFEFDSNYHLRQRVYRACKAAKVEYKAWRALRTTAGLRLLETLPTVDVARHLGLHPYESPRGLVKLSGKAKRRAKPE